MSLIIMYLCVTKRIVKMHSFIIMRSIINVLESENIETIFCIIWTFRIINCMNIKLYSVMIYERTTVYTQYALL